MLLSLSSWPLLLLSSLLALRSSVAAWSPVTVHLHHRPAPSSDFPYITLTYFQVPRGVCVDTAFQSDRVFINSVSITGLPPGSTATAYNPRALSSCIGKKVAAGYALDDGSWSYTGTAQGVRWMHCQDDVVPPEAGVAWKLFEASVAMARDAFTFMPFGECVFPQDMRQEQQGEEAIYAAWTGEPDLVKVDEQEYWARDEVGNAIIGQDGRNIYKDGEKNVLDLRRLLAQISPPRTPTQMWKGPNSGRAGVIGGA
ncbi:MAG: hypothetical protein M1833_006704 [Piccolia ochrophora]|nr:MAG: hypothetical protein M1833_006704 [Piccolia ochrophora]